MIKTIIAGAHTPIGGELIRLLLNHPEVEITTLYSPDHAGVRADRMHHGLIGETTLKMVSEMSPEKSDVIFICERDHAVETLMSDLEQYSDLRIIDLTCKDALGAEAEGFTYGLPEMNRKSLVRGARRAVIPGPVESVVLTALYPLVSHLLLNARLYVRVEGDATLLDADDMLKAQHEISTRLARIQQSFDKGISITSSEISAHRWLNITVETESLISPQEAETLYEQIYDDHNFTYMAENPCGPEETVGTNRIIISVDGDDKMLRITASADGRMRGGAAEAVHVMNLLFGLHEKTGLALKASMYNPYKDSQNVG